MRDKFVKKLTVVLMERVNRMKDVSENYHFVIVLSRVEAISSELEDSLYEAGCSDALIASRDGVVYLVFDRRASSFEGAVLSAVDDIHSSKLEIAISHIEPSDIVSLSEIARRLDRTRESIRLLAKGDRGDGTFPSPISGVEETTQLWSWVEVAKWFFNHSIVNSSVLEKAILTKIINSKLSSLDQYDKSNICTTVLSRCILENQKTHIHHIAQKDASQYGIIKNGDILLKDEFTFFLMNQEELVRKYKNQFLVIKSEKLVRAFDTLNQAYQFGTSTYPLGNFLLQKCLPGPIAYRKACISRVRKAEEWEEEFVEANKARS